MAESFHGQVIFEETVRNPDLMAARTLRHALESVEKDVLPTEAQEGFSLFISETITNLVEHSHPVADNVTVELSASTGTWVCRILDDGPPFKGFRASLAKAQEAWNASAGNRESGMGLALITQTFPDFWYERGDQAEGRPNVFGVRYPARRSVITRPHIVIVDDSIIFRLSIRSLLIDEYFVRSFPDAGSALKGLHDGPVDLIISDIQMPEMDGLQFREELSARGDDLIPFIFLTGESNEAVAHKANDLGIDDYIVKPVTASKLKPAIRRLLRRRESMREKLWQELSREATESLEITTMAQIHELECAVRRRVASAGGGDLCLPIGSDGVFFADVMGHGIAAKMAAHSIAAYVRGLALKSGEDWTPSELMTTISNAIGADESFDAIIVSALLARVATGGSVHIASAGHPFPGYFAPDQTRYVEVGGPLLGMAENQIYKTVEIRLAAGTALMFLTDGLFEISKSDDAQREAEKNIFRAASIAVTGNAEDIAEAVISMFDELTDGQPPDDATIFVMKA